MDLTPKTSTAILLSQPSDKAQKQARLRSYREATLADALPEPCPFRSLSLLFNKDVSV